MKKMIAGLATLVTTTGVFANTTKKELVCKCEEKVVEKVEKKVEKKPAKKITTITTAKKDNKKVEEKKDPKDVKGQPKAQIKTTKKSSTKTTTTTPKKTTKKEVKKEVKKTTSSTRLEDNVINVKDVTLELHKNTRRDIKKAREKYGKRPNFSYPIKFSKVEYESKGDVKYTFNSVVYLDPVLAERILNDKSVNKVVLKKAQKKHKSQPVYIVKEKDPVFISNLEPDCAEKKTEKKVTTASADKDTLSVNL